MFKIIKQNTKIQTHSKNGNRFKLAEHRYSKEEMLSMFKVSTGMPLSDVTTHKIFSPECQPPLNSQPITEAEQVLMTYYYNISSSYKNYF